MSRNVRKNEFLGVKVAVSLNCEGKIVGFVLLDDRS